MSEPTNPSTIAREVLRLLSTRRIAPTPDNYRQLYQRIAGHPEAAPAPEAEAEASQDAPAWGPLILELLKQWEIRHVGLTTARKRESLEKLIGASGSNPARLANRLQNLVKSWSATSPAEGRDQGAESAVVPPLESAPVSGPTAPRAIVSAVDGGDPLAQLRELLAQTLEFAVISQLGHVPDLAAEATKLAVAARSAIDADTISKLSGSLRQFWFKLEMRGSDNTELHQGLLRLLNLLIENTHELVSDDQWLRGQVAVLQEIVSRPLDVKAIVEAERRLKEVIFKQGTLRTSLQDAKAALKHLITSFIDRLGDLSESTDGYHSRLEGYAEQIRQTDDISQLNVVLDNLLRDTRSAQLDAARLRDDLLASRRQVEAAEQKVRELEHELEHVSELVQEDQLTGVLNRRGLDDAYQREAARAERSGKPLCISLLDIDNFKRLNDAHGHQTGDQALQHLVRVTRRTMRPTDVLARYGGEEFLLLLPDTSQEEAIEVMVRLQRNLTKAFFLHEDEHVLITFSAGVALLREGEAQTAVIERADKAMYEAKRTGKNRVCAA
ncbi:MAG TPA: diguanylate cyclase [Azonexus sp.]|nr:diguanylate cyclase [Azonexus sp.]